MGLKVYGAGLQIPCKLVGAETRRPPVQIREPPQPYLCLNNKFTQKGGLARLSIDVQRIIRYFKRLFSETFSGVYRFPDTAHLLMTSWKTASKIQGINLRFLGILHRFPYSAYRRIPRRIRLSTASSPTDITSARYECTGDR